MKTSTVLRRSVFLAVALTLCSTMCLASKIGPTFFAWRSLGYYSNDKPNIVTKCFLGSDNTPATGETGQAFQGWHELHPSEGFQTASFADMLDAVPTIAGPVMARVDQGTFFDIPIYWVYEADGYVWGQSFKELGQTFVATGDELVKVSCLVVTPQDTFDVVVRKGGPDGEQVGSTRTLESGHSMSWGIARWLPGDVPLEVGETYYIGLKGQSGRAFTTYVHSTGDIYSGGCAYYDGVAEPITDLALFISCQRDDVIRSPVLYTYDDDGWVKHTRGVYFKARSSNIRAISSQMKFKGSPFHIDAYYRIFRLEPSGELVRIGKDKKCYNFASPGKMHYTTVLYDADDIPIEVGKTYYLEIVPKDKELPEDEMLIPKRDLLVNIYGEKTPGMNPIIFNQKVAETTSTSIKLEWESSDDCDTNIYYGLKPTDLKYHIKVPAGKQEAVIHPIAPGVTVNFRFVLKSDLGGKFETPIYQARTLDADGNVVTDPPLLRVPGGPEYANWTKQDPPPGGFINLAPRDEILVKQPPLPKATEVKDIPVVNADFEDGLTGWETSKAEYIKCHRMGKAGGSAGGWNINFTENVAYGSFAEEEMYQTVKVTKGKKYMLSAWVCADQSEISTMEQDRAQNGDTRVRLICDPTGGTNFGGHNSTQGFNTRGQWLQFAKVWTAESDTIAIGVGFFRWRDWNTVTALADSIRLVEVK